MRLQSFQCVNFSINISLEFRNRAIQLQSSLLYQAAVAAVKVIMEAAAFNKQ